MSQSYAYRNQQLVAVEPSAQPVLVADSFLVIDGRTRSLDLHLDRFRRGIQNKAPELLPNLENFLEQALALIPRTGRFFPRIELREELLVHIRPAPAQLGPATVWTYPEPDPRLDLSTKGPELELGQIMREQAAVNGADEAVLLTSYGEVSEGALSSLVWWRGDLLCAPGVEIPWLESVTRTEIFTVAKSLNIQTRMEHVRPADLVGFELWLLSSLQGIRVVKNWVGLSNDFKSGEHVERFNQRLKLLETQLP